MTRTPVSSVKLLTLVALLVFTPRWSHGFTFSPMSVELSPAGKGTSQNFEVFNSAEKPIAIEISIVPRKNDSKGQEVFEKGSGTDKKFLLYPTQITLGPKEKRTIRVNWVGEPNPEKELAYRIIAEELPVQLEKSPEKNGVSIKMLLRYVASIYITPKGVAPKLEVTQAEFKKNTLNLEITNSGTAHKVVNQARLTHLGPPDLEIPVKFLDSLKGINFLAGEKKHFEIQATDKFFNPLKSKPSKDLKFKFEATD